MNDEIRKTRSSEVLYRLTKRQEQQFLRKADHFLSNFPDMIYEVPKEKVRELLLMTIKRIWVKDKKVVAIEPRDDFKPLFASYRKVIGQSPLLTPLGDFLQ